MLAVSRLQSLAAALSAGPYAGYAYSYPHKTAYRTLAPSRILADVWRHEPRDSLFLYLHVPFCEMRCGFCNLFTYSQPADEWVARYLAALRQEMQVVAAAVPGATFTRLAIGGGTPTFLKAAELANLFDQVQAVLSVQCNAIPISVEASPGTVDDEKLAVLRHYQVERLSLGIQSFAQPDLGAMGRPQRLSDVWRAIERIKQSGIPQLNLDLIYGASEQTPARWLESLRQAVVCQPQEVYLYPMYVRPLTGLSGARLHPAKGSLPADDNRRALYRQGRDFLLECGYEQVSMRMFRRGEQREVAAPVYCCQSDGMIGLGAGARSYTRTLHYATPFAVRQKSILSIIDAYSRQSPAGMAQIGHGFELDERERRRRHVILSLLQAAGLDAHHYRQHFASDLWDDFPQLEEVVELGLARRADGQLILTAGGLEQSDVFGPWLYSGEVSRRMQEYAWTAT